MLKHALYTRLFQPLECLEAVSEKGSLCCCFFFLMSCGKKEIVMMEMPLESYLLHGTILSSTTVCKFFSGFYWELMFPREIPKSELFQYEFHNSMKSFIKLSIMSLSKIIFAIAGYVVTVERGKCLVNTHIFTQIYNYYIIYFIIPITMYNIFLYILYM